MSAILSSIVFIKSVSGEKVSTGIAYNPFVESSKDVLFDVVFETDGVKVELDIDLLLFSPFCAMVLGKDHLISEQMICTRLIPMNNSLTTENIAEDFVDSFTEECLLLNVEYMHETISLFTIPVNEL
ncbi:20306_t:CDS:2 [Funneliformis geosporum]|uniref:17439_t:CDS:1 n=1 Tax=Funneliformis geosporum TaxID=1117311 RepID=A0A9W4SLL9_9GLOM|nr:17439_t:CDS:2 [Funneliformis geosporum]CAI2174033.1 20306_t:CDS:2 [Funneliformis geosporum]